MSSDRFSSGFLPKLKRDMVMTKQDAISIVKPLISAISLRILLIVAGAINDSIVGESISMNRVY